MTELDLTFVEQAVERIGREEEAVIPILQAIQEHYRYLPPEALERISQITRITPAAIAGVSTFYGQFRHRPVGRHVVRICHGTACHVKGSSLVHDALCRQLGLGADGDTDASGEFTLERVACLGCCTLAPVIQIDSVTYGHLTPDKVGDVLRDFLALSQARQKQIRRREKSGLAKAGQILLGLGSCCVARGSARVQEALEQAIWETAAAAEVKRVGCVGMCHHTPLVEVIDPQGKSFLYARVRSEDARAIVLRHFQPSGLGRRIGAAVSGMLERVLTDEAWQGVTRYALNVRDLPVESFLGPQRRLATEHSGRIDPLDLDEYLRYDGFVSLRRCAEGLEPQEIIRRISASGLRGRGGAGYPTGRKWEAVRAAAGEAKTVICNADEGDPGAFMDRMILESFPYRVIEGMAIAARAVGAEKGILYIRAEYPLAVQRVRHALEMCRGRGLLGDGMLEGRQRLDLRVMEGAGAFVCGEETALIASLEGRRGMPRLRPPYPSESGLHGRPTLVNNVETFALVPWIIRNGPEAFAALGTGSSKGAKVFALAGKVARGGLIEVPMGISLRRIVEEIGGGIAGGKAFKAVQVGGPSGGCVPAAMADLPVDYEALTAAGAIMGSGGLVVLDEDDCMVDIARYFLQFTQDQSCGKCTFCRVGTRRMLDILDRLCEGQGRGDDLRQLEELAGLVRQGSLCGLGKTAPNPVLSTLKYFRDEYEAHLRKTCPAGRCRALIRYAITDDCIGCTLCAQHCPVDAIAMRPYEKHQVDDAKCIRCGTCRTVCQSKAVRVE